MADTALTCRELVEIVTDYLEGAMLEPDRSRFESHLAECTGCQAYLGQMRRTIELTGRLPEESIPPGARDRLLEAFGDWRRGSSAT